MERKAAPGSSPTAAEKASKLREMSGCTITEAGNILDACGGNLQQAISVFFASLQSVQRSENSPGSSEAAGYTPSTGLGVVAQETGGMEVTTRTEGDGASPANGPKADVASGTVNNPIDLTKEDDALQKALALSMQDLHQQQLAGGGPGGISLEDQELSRALEASLAENQSALTQLGLPLMSVFVDPLNPHERRRAGQTPVGLKNVGNTCWFSAVIQSLFHIPIFQELIVKFHPPLQSNGVTEMQQCVQFVLELQKVFSLLLKSERKYINPLMAIQSLREAFTKGPSSTGAQQDVSEFTHKLLEWIEDAFKLTLEGRESAHNPVVGLFNGQCRTEGVLNGQPYVNESTFGAFPVQVQGHRHLHDSLEAAICSHDMQQETWFTHLPPILVLELARFKYNQQTGQVEKVHDPLTFTKELFLDRYLERNKVESRSRRREVALLKGKLGKLQKRLYSYTHYDHKPVSISEVLALTLKFVHNQESDGGREDEEREREREGGEGRLGKRPRTSTYPLAKRVSLGEVTTLNTCLTRWIAEVEQEMQELKESIAATQDSLDAVYTDELMNSTCYHLHAVLVHQGQASGGHYWAYIRNNQFVEKQPVGPGVGSHDQSGRGHQSGAVTTPLESGDDVVLESQSESEIEVSTPQSGQTGSTSSETGSNDKPEDTEDGSKQTSKFISKPGQTSQTGATSGEECAGGRGGRSWLKFNDVSVSEVSWEEVKRESYGGHNQNTSAYCLMYVSSAVRSQLSGPLVGPELSPGLRRYVEDDNSAFRSEMEEYDRKSREKLAQPSGEGSDASGHTSPDTVVDEAQPSDARPVAPQHDTSPEHMQVDNPSLPPIDDELFSLLKRREREKYSEYEGLGRGQVVEPRPSHVVTYAILSKASEDVVRALILQELSADSSERHEIQLLAAKEFVSVLSQANMQRHLDVIRSLFRMFCNACYHCVQAVQANKQQKWHDALLHSVFAFKINHDICSQYRHQFALEPWIVGEIRRQALVGVSNKAKMLFEEGQIQASFTIADSLLIPALRTFSQMMSDDDEEVLETIREDWCQCLVHPALNEGEQERLAALLTRMFEDHSKSAPLAHPPSPPDFDRRSLVVDFYTATSNIHEHRHTK